MYGVAPAPITLSAVRRPGDRHDRGTGGTDRHRSAFGRAPVAGERLGGDVGQQAGHGDRATDQDAVDDPQAAKAGVPICRGDCARSSAHPDRGCPSPLKHHLSVHENSLEARNATIGERDRPYDGLVGHIVLIEDEPGIVDFIDRGLSARGLEVRTATDGETGVDLALSEQVDLVVLDLMLPRKSGMEVLGELARERPGLPVIVLTARGEIEDRVGGLDAGAVDYLVKPFALAELEARIRAHLRVARQAPATSVRRAGLEIDLIARTVHNNGELVRLTNTEFDLLAYFMNHPGQVLNRQQILRAVWGYGHDPATNIVDVYIGYLRRKLASDDRPAPIKTVRSRGYRLEELS
jgi:DNA-binding response OmpR family regulator